MTLSRFAPIVGALTISAVLSTAGLVPTAASAPGAEETLAASSIADADMDCGTGPATFDDVTTRAATTIRTVVPPEQLSAYDRQVDQFRRAIAAVHVHRDTLPVAPVNDRTEFLDDAIVTNLVNTLDAVRTGRIDQTVSVSQLTVNDAIEAFILGARIVKIPTQLGASLVPGVGFLLKPIVAALHYGVKYLAREVQDQLSRSCDTPGAYQKLQLDAPPDEHISVPQPLVELANKLVLADDRCTPVAELKASEVVERTRGFLAHSTELGLDADTVNTNAAALQEILRDTRVPNAMILRRTEELGPLVDMFDWGPLTFLSNLGFDIYEGKVDDSVVLADMKVENAFDLVTLALDTTALLMSTSNFLVGLVGPAALVTIPLQFVETLAFAPTTYGAPIMKGVMQSMCAV